MFGLGLPEIIIILAALAVLFFGGKKVSELARGMGKFTGEFKKGKMEIEKELKEARDEDAVSNRGEQSEGKREV